jgi:hypothetical protein
MEAAMNDRPPFGRKPLVELLGADEHRGSAEVAAKLSAALDEAAAQSADTLTHGFHSYPARMHPSIARSLLSSFATPSDVILDPFCGSGTVPIEAMLAGNVAMGSDLGPLAVELAFVKSRLLTHPQLVALRERAYAIGERSTERVQARAAVQANVSKTVAAKYAPHVLKELAGLLAEIDAGPNDEDRRTLRLVFSSLLVKVSKRRADTSDKEMEKRIRKGLTTEMFVHKTEELVERYRALRDAAPNTAKAPRFVLGDARRLASIVGDRKIDVVITSPPYGGTYDYAEHHVERSAWLGLDDRALRHNEIGARRHAQGENANVRWDAAVHDVLTSIRDVVAQGARVMLLIGDGELDGHRVDASDHVASLAELSHMRFVASASAPRPDWLGGAPRREHLIALEPFSRKTPTGPKARRFTPSRSDGPKSPRGSGAGSGDRRRGRS